MAMVDCYSTDTSDIGRLHPPTRNNYFFGKLLDVQHFTLEQRYVNNKRWLLNRLGFGSGVVCGLRLEVVDGQLILQPGVAIDPFGREIIVPAAVVIDPYHITDACGRTIKAVGDRSMQPAPGSGIASSGVDMGENLVTICLAYHQCETEMVPVLISDCETREGCAPSTIRESFAILVQEGGATSAIPECAIPGLFIPAENASRVDMVDLFARVLGRVDQACADVGRGACVVLGDVMLPPGGSMLVDADVSYTGRQVVLNNQLLFEMILCLWERVEQCCAQSPATPMPPATVAPTISPGVPPATVPPTEQPPATSVPPTPLLQVLEVAIMSVPAGTIDPIQTLALMRPGMDPAQPLVVKVADRPNVIQVRFDGALVEIASVIPGKTFLVERFDQTGGSLEIPGQISPVGQPGQTNTIRFQSTDQLGAGRYRVTLKGDSPAIMSTIGLPLDGDPRQLPSGNMVAGGDFVFELDVV
jgi:hypothetical protein